MSVLRVAGWVVAVGFTCGGCLPPSTVRLYDGERLATAKVSRLVNGEHAVVRRIDDRPFHRDKHMFIETFELRPGRHRIVVGPPTFKDPGRHPGDVTYTFEFDFEAGRSYGFAVAEMHGGGLDGYDVRLVDIATGRQVARPLELPALPARPEQRRSAPPPGSTL